MLLILHMQYDLVNNNKPAQGANPGIETVSQEGSGWS
jgi:hypothetical protein